MAAGDATAADVPVKYDCVINGKGYCFADSVEPSLPFRTHRAIYDISPTFVERQNVSNQYGDQAQDFFLTASQNDWSEGEDQRFFRLADGDSKRRYWKGLNVDVGIPGQVTLQNAVKTFTLAAASSCVTGASFSAFSAAPFMFATTSTNLYMINAALTLTDVGAHGLGVTPLAMATDSNYVYISGASAGKIRKFTPTSGTAGTFADFNATTSAESLAYTNNTLYGADHQVLYQFDTAGNATSLFSWKDATGGSFVGSGCMNALTPFGGKLAILRSDGSSPRGAEVWIYDGVAPVKVAELPPNFNVMPGINPFQFCVAEGIIFVIGQLKRQGGSKTAIWYLANGTPGYLWQSDHYSSITNGPGSIIEFDSGVLFTDYVDGTLRYANLATGGVSTYGTITPAQITSIAVGGYAALFANSTTSLTYFPDSTYPSSGSVSSSLIDFENSLTKTFRGIKVDWQAATDGNGGSVDISYQVDSLDGSYTSLQTGAVSGTEYTLSGISGHAISVKITLNKGTSTKGPTLKRVYVRAAPQLQQFKSGLYILDCTNTASQPRELRNGTYHPLTGYEQVQNLLTAAKATTPFSVTDKVNGTFTALVDLSDSEGWDVYEVHPDADNPSKPGTYMVRVKVREV